LCGICGLFNVEFSPKYILEKQDRRGGDAAGILFKTEKGWSVKKGNILQSGLIESLTEEERKRIFESPIVIGHSRLATRGSPPQMENNHPIITPDIIGVHNGTVTYSKEKELNRNAEVDSEIIFLLLETEMKNLRSDFSNLKEVVEKSLHDLNGRGSCLFIHKNFPNVVFFLNFRKEAPYIYRVEFKGKRGLIVSSESLAIEFSFLKEIEGKDFSWSIVSPEENMVAVISEANVIKKFEISLPYIASVYKYHNIYMWTRDGEPFSYVKDLIDFTIEDLCPLLKLNVVGFDIIEKDGKLFPIEGNVAIGMGRYTAPPVYEAIQELWG